MTGTRAGPGLYRCLDVRYNDRILFAGNLLDECRHSVLLAVNDPHLSHWPEVGDWEETFPTQALY